jgi:hypothetical protein
MAFKVADMHAHVQKLISVVKMATVLKECTYYRKATFCCAIVLWVKWLSAKDIHKEMLTAGDVASISLV